MYIFHDSWTYIYCIGCIDIWEHKKPYASASGARGHYGGLTRSINSYLNKIWFSFSYFAFPEDISLCVCVHMSTVIGSQRLRLYRDGFTLITMIRLQWL